MHSYSVGLFVGISLCSKVIFDLCFTEFHVENILTIRQAENKDGQMRARYSVVRFLDLQFDWFQSTMMWHYSFFVFCCHSTVCNAMYQSGIVESG